jgi:IgA Peptidase M64/FG-GAP-like repeat
MKTLHRGVVAVLMLSAAGGAQAQTVAELLRNGANGDKINLVIIGDGFTAGADQATFNTFVQNTVIRDLFDEKRNGAYREILDAFNIFRINATSAATGISTISHANDTTNADGSTNHTNDVITTVNTFLGYRFSGVWQNCWMEPGPNTNATLTNTLNALVPGWTHVFVVLNTTAGGGCRRGNTLAITRGGDWTVAAHEMGHMIGDLGDEYTGNANYTGTEPPKLNLTIDSNRATVKWRAFVSPNTAVPTPAGFGGDAVEDAGVFAGGTFVLNNTSTRFNTGIFRPSLNSRMNSNQPEFDSIGYDQMRRVAGQHQDHRYQHVYAGRFTGRAGSDVVVHQENAVFLFTGTSDSLAPTWVRTMPDPVWDSFRPGDRFLVGDFDGDGKQDLFVYNFTDWNQPYFAMLHANGQGFDGVRRFDRDLPGWGEMKAHDQFFVADIDGDRRDDIVVFNGDDWSMGYLLLLHSTGNNLTFVRRFDDTLPGWGAMRRNDKFQVGDFNGDGRADLYVTNLTDWSVGYLEMLRSTGNNLAFVRRFDQKLPGWDDMKPGDQFFVGDVNGDRRKDLYVFNGSDWSEPYLEMLGSTGSDMTNVRRFDGSVPGWGEMRRNDRWYVADVNGDGRADLYVFNALDWSEEYLGLLRSSGTTLGGGFQANWIGSWNLGPPDNFVVANFNGGSNWDDLLVHNDGWFGLLRSNTSSLSLSAIYPEWIHNHRFHNLGWW